MRGAEWDADERDVEREIEDQGSEMSRSRDTVASLGMGESLGVEVSLAGGVTKEVDSVREGV